MNFDSYIVSETKTALSIPVSTSVLSSRKTIKQKAFTLAEVLITLSIIGIVAAMTVPTLMANVNKQIYVTGLKKAYNQLQNAMRMMPISEGCSAGDFECVGLPEIGWDESSYFWDTTAELLSRQYKVKKICYKKTDPGCDWDRNPQMFPGFMTEDGSQVFVTRSSTFGIKVDVNGEKGPNKDGQDIFDFYIVTSKYWGNATNLPIGTVLPAGSQKVADAFNQSSYAYWKTNKNCVDEGNWNLCAARVLETGKIDY